MSRNIGKRTAKAGRVWTCVRDGRVNVCEAATAEEAAEAACKAVHRDYWALAQGTGTDSHGEYQLFAFMAGSRAAGGVRVYANYTH